MSKCNECGSDINCHECNGTEVVSIVFTLQGKQDNRWFDIFTAMNVTHSKAIEEYKIYKDWLEERPQDMNWTDFRIIRIEKIVV